MTIPIESHIRTAPLSRERVIYLDGWRGLAILFVLGGHFLPLPKSFDFGFFGVAVFFVLSGRLMADILFIERVPLGLFFRRRISRVFPLYYLFIAVVFAWALARDGRAPFRELLPLLLFLRTYLPWGEHIWSSTMPIGHIWSLNVEEWSYVLLALLTLVVGVRSRGAAAILLAAAAISSWIPVLYAEIPAIAPTWETLGLEVASAFITAAAGMRICQRSFAYRAPTWVSPLAFLLALASRSPLAPWWIQYVAPPMLLAISVNALDSTYPAIQRTLEMKALVWFGAYSFSIYIWQQPFYAHRGDFPIGVALLLALVTSTVSFRFFEDPIRRWLNSHWGRRGDRNLPAGR